MPDHSRMNVAGALCFVVSLGLGLAAPAKAGALRLPRLFSNNMVLQRNIQAPVWGWAAPGATVSVEIDERSASATAGQDGTWRLKLDPLEAGGPFALTVSSGADTIRVSNVLVGEVWLCSGQSNMGLTLGDINASQTIGQAGNYPTIRNFQTTYALASEPRDEVAVSSTTTWLSTWEVSSASSAPHFSAAGYYFALYLQARLGVPIGLINNSAGGTVAEAWSGSAVFEDPRLAPILTDWPQYTQEEDWIHSTYEDYLKSVEQAAQQGLPKPLYFCQPSVLYNGMTAPLMPYGIRGVTWYQGEGNIYRAEQYSVLFPALIRNWRQGWGQGDFPFLFVQLANYESGTGHWPELREAQKQGLSLPNTGMAVAIDVGEAGDIHPKNKREVGRRLSLLARSLVYGDTVLCSGPVLSAVTVKADSCYLTFGQTGGGLRAGGSGRLGGFSLAGRDSLFHSATASLVDGRVALWSASVKEPSAVRYAWADNPVGANLYNTDGDSLALPASPFQWWRRSGDLDGNDRVDVFDLLGMLKMLGGAAPPSGFADLDSDGKVGVFDLLQMLKRMSL